MITNFNHVGEGQVRFTLKSGARFTMPVMNNDRAHRVLWIEESEGNLAAISYDEIDHVSLRTVHA